MSRITKVKGEFMGVPFEVKPTPIRFDKVVEDRRQMMLEWYKENYPSLHKKLVDENASLEDYTQEDMVAISAWKLDVEFRAKYCKYMADHCMKLSKPLSDEVWQSDDLELGTLEEAWDFFTSKRQVPLSGLGQP